MINHKRGGIRRLDGSVVFNCAVCPGRIPHISNNSSFQKKSRYILKPPRVLYNHIMETVLHSSIAMLGIVAGDCVDESDSIYPRS